MSRDADIIRADIERTRVTLGADVDAVADKVTPSKVVGRQTDKLKSAVGGVKDRVMGAAEHVHDGAVAGADGVAHAAGRAKDKASGNPLAVGLIALGVGWLAASLVPASRHEQQLLDAAKEAAEPLAHELGDIAKESAEHLKEPAQDAVHTVQESVDESVQAVKGDAEQAADDVRDTTTG
ncbi:DUF3618 domain-containing protein [Microcella sp.]|uniref:DUF3618 domain-containing protein n=1 Tax=Microcella sp. TaxID=1913979 RepID=UPI00391B6744